MGQNSDDLPGWICFSFFADPFRKNHIPYSLQIWCTLYNIYIYIHKYIWYIHMYRLYVCEYPLTKMGQYKQWSPLTGEDLQDADLNFGPRWERWKSDEKFREDPSTGGLKGGDDRWCVFQKSTFREILEGFNNTLLYSSILFYTILYYSILFFSSYFEYFEQKPGFILWLLTWMILVPSFYGGIWCPNHVL